MLLIIVVEADSGSKSDYIYIQKYLKKFFVVDDGNVKISPVFTEGKDNYKANKVTSDIDKLKRFYSSQYSSNNQSIIMLCVDTDDLAGGSNAKENECKIKKIARYCESQDFEFVWFCRDIEEVFQNKRVTKKEKKESAERYRKSDLEKLNKEKFKATDYGICRNGTSNLDIVLSKYLKKK